MTRENCLFAPGLDTSAKCPKKTRKFGLFHGGNLRSGKERQKIVKTLLTLVHRLTILSTTIDSNVIPKIALEFEQELFVRPV